VLLGNGSTGSSLSGLVVCDHGGGGMLEGEGAVCVLGRWPGRSVMMAEVEGHIE
jgi:hypothetical protein